MTTQNNISPVEMLKANRDKVEREYQLMLKQAESLGKRYFTSKKFFFQVVLDHFESLSKVMVGKINRSEVVFYEQLYKATERAQYACAKPEREANKGLFA